MGKGALGAVPTISFVNNVVGTARRARAFATLRALPHAAKFLRRPVEHRQRALGDAEIGAMQMQLAALGGGPDKRKRHQVFQASEYRGLLDPGGEISRRLGGALPDTLDGLD